MREKWSIISCALGVFITLLFACDSNPYKHGEIMYGNFCASCHMEDGTGLLGEIPPLAGADYLADNQEQLACIIRYGIAEKLVVNGKTYKQPMAGVPQLTDVEIANIINYINTSWNNDLPVVTIGRIREQLAKCKSVGIGQ